MANEVQYVTVMSGLAPNADGSHRVALWEPHPLHPEDAQGNHEAYVAGPTPVKVAMTAAVMGGLREGTLVEATADGEPRDRPSAAVREVVEPERAGRGR